MTTEFDPTEATVFEIDRPTMSVALHIKDRRAMDLLWAYAARVRMVDPVFSKQLEEALYSAGFTLPAVKSHKLIDLLETITFLPEGALGYASDVTPPYKRDIIPLAIFGLKNAIAQLKAVEAAQEKQT